MAGFSFHVWWLVGGSLLRQSPPSVDSSPGLHRSILPKLRHISCTIPNDYIIVHTIDSRLYENRKKRFDASYYLPAAIAQHTINFPSSPNSLSSDCILPSPLIRAHTESIKLDSRDTPPPLHHSPATSELGRASTAEPTPVGTPRAFQPLQRRNWEKEKDHALSPWHGPTHVFARNQSSYVDSTLLEGDLEDSTFPLFGELMSDSAMAPLPNPNGNASSTSWQNQPSNLTTALHSTSGNEVRPAQAMNIAGANRKPGSFVMGRRESLGGVSGSDWKSSSGAQPISVNREKPRRESLAGSMVGGMSWGGVSVGSWVRDE